MAGKRLDIMGIFKECGALLTGHFMLSSGLHSGRYLQCALVLQYPRYARLLAEAIAARFKKDKITVVAGPAMGGIIIAHEVASALAGRCVFGEREKGRVKLRRGFSVSRRDRVLLVEDVVTTGGSLEELAELIKSAGAHVAGAASIIDRSGGKFDFGPKQVSLAKLKIGTYVPEECPLCKKGIPVTKPGSRKIV